MPVFRQKLESGLLEQLTAAGNQFAFAPAHVNKQRAGAVGTLALQYIREGRTETADEHQPEYLRMAQAEREAICSRQAQGIAAAKARGVRFGRPRLPVPEGFEGLKAQWEQGKISSRQAAQQLHISHQTFLRWAKEK